MSQAVSPGAQSSWFGHSPLSSGVALPEHCACGCGQFPLLSGCDPPGHWDGDGQSLRSPVNSSPSRLSPSRSSSSRLRRMVDDVEDDELLELELLELDVVGHGVQSFSRSLLRVVDDVDDELDDDDEEDVVGQLAAVCSSS